jgi:hypothetical protein
VSYFDHVAALRNGWHLEDIGNQKLRGAMVGVFSGGVKDKKTQ